MAISLRTAQTAWEKNEIYKLRYRVFVEEEKRFQYSPDLIFDVYDTLNENINFFAMEAGQVVGSLRATIDNPIGMPALEHYDFGPLIKRTPGRFASIGWLCVSESYRRHRGILPALFKMMVRETKKKGVRHLIAPLHPAILPLLERFGAKAVDKEFFSKELNVSMVPIHIDYGDLPPGLREFSQDPFGIIFEDSNERRIYRQGETIVEKETIGNEAFLIMRGSVEVLLHNDGRSTPRSTAPAVDKKTAGNPLLGQGQLFGEQSLLDGGPRTATVICHSKEVDLMVWTREQLFNQLGKDNEKAMSLCKILANRLRMEVVGYRKDASHNALVATIIMDASRKKRESVNLAWLASQCGFRLKEMVALIDLWTSEGVVCCDDGKTLHVCSLDKLKKKMIWK